MQLLDANFPCTLCAGDIAEGIRIYERALAYNPQYPDALYNLGVACGEVVRTYHALSQIRLDYPDWDMM